MRDRQTGTVWAHLDGDAERGPLTGERLTIVPLPQMTWGEWRNEYPESLVLDPDTLYKDRYSSPVRIGAPGRDEAQYGDDRLPSKALVVGVEVDGDFVGFPIEQVSSEEGVINAEVGGRPVVVLYDARAQTGIAYLRTIEGRDLAFEVEVSPDTPLTFLDTETGSVWNVHGKAISGPLAGASLTFVPSLISEWYGWSAYHPETGLYP